MDRSRARCDWLAIWILWSAWCTAAGWFLSEFGWLDRTGYACALVFFLAALFLTRRSWIVPSTRPLFLLRRSTFRRLLPKFWLALVVISLIGGLSYHGDNYDYLTYRFPRVLHWWWAHRWYWIDTTTDRMNYSSTGFEWLMTPLMVFFRSDRPFFLLNFVSYLLLPGLIFSVFRHLGVSGRTAWWWMWTLPAGLCYALEAGGVGNDMFAGVYLLAAFHYGWKAHPGSAVFLVLSILAMALLTSAKASNIPLGLPWLVLLAFQRRCFPRDARGWGALFAAALVGLLVSAVPIFLANVHFTGDYAGDPTNAYRLKLANPLGGLVGNSLLILFANLSPPILPHDMAWTFLPAGLLHWLAGACPRFMPWSPALRLEESGCLGLGVTFFFLLSFFYGWRARLRPSAPVAPTLTKWIALGTLAAWLGYFLKLGSEAAPRLMAPYYILAIGVLIGLLPFDGVLTHRKVWHGFGYLAWLMAIAVVGLTPGRPILPAPLLVSGLRVLHAPAGVIQSWSDNEALRASRFDNVALLRAAIPISETTVGLIAGFDNPTVSLWLPFGSRDVVEFDLNRVTPFLLQQHGIRYIVVSDEYLSYRYHLSLADFLKNFSATVIQSTQVNFKTSRAPEAWHLVRL